jgi:endonuclease/exonuclease/phosphatase (EEP) superfamily protein YafD
MPARLSWSRVATTAALPALAWTWLLLPQLGGFGEIVAVAAPAIFATVLAVHVVSLVLRRRIVVLISAVVWLVSGTVMVVSPRTPKHFSAPRDPVSLVAANLHFHNSAPHEAALDVAARRADVVVISEATPATESVLASAYAFHIKSVRPRLSQFEEFVASRYRLRVRRTPPELRQALIVEVMAPTPFLLVAVHLPRAGIDVPSLRGSVSFSGQRRAVDAVIRLTHDRDLPVVVAGDLNVSDRTAEYRRLVSHRRDAMRAGWAGSTYRPFPWSFLAVRIDHVLIDRTWCAAHAGRFHPAGSDHNAVEVQIGPCP